MASIGTVSPEKVDYAAALLSTLPERVAEAVREPLGAVTTIYGLLLDEDDAVRNLQLQCIDQGAGPRTVEELQRLQPALNGLSPESRLPLVEMAVPALCRLSAAQYRSFCQVIRSLVEADKQIDLFEFALQRLLLRQLAPHHVPQKPRPVQRALPG